MPVERPALTEALAAVGMRIVQTNHDPGRGAVMGRILSPGVIVGLRDRSRAVVSFDDDPEPRTVGLECLHKESSPPGGSGGHPDPREIPDGGP